MVELVNVFQSVSVYIYASLRAYYMYIGVRNIPQRAPLSRCPRCAHAAYRRSGTRRELSVNFRRLFCNAHKLEVKLSS